ncbi:hypothetical protein KUCAC02_011034 [Chaenocephalus aceratus]|uniref:Uncharacterized protein n=1 Tax=Chaenocephalus aceratus TaxID=36190 RepID=A0ACB9WUJ3_CHAAC|nr:hypothetical protein KUCAC02_011034 [Chaenocephalus aceratus]
MTYQTDSSCGRGGFSAGHSPCCGPGLFDRRLGRDATDTPGLGSLLRLSIKLKLALGPSLLPLRHRCPLTSRRKAPPVTLRRPYGSPAPQEVQLAFTKM